MNDPQHEIRLWMQEELARKGHGAKSQLAAFLNVRADAITRMMNTSPGKEKREIRAHEMDAMREFFGHPVDHREEPDEDGGESEETVPLVGYVGAGAEAHYYAVSPGELERVHAPKNGAQNTVAAEIHGTSMGNLLNRWLVYYDEVRSPVTPDLIGIPCVVWLADERVLVKRIKATRTPGLFDLESNTGEETIRSVAIVWAAKVRSIEPR